MEPDYNPTIKYCIDWFKLNFNVMAGKLEIFKFEQNLNVNGLTKI